MEVLRNNVARTHNNGYREKTRSVTNYECVSLFSFLSYRHAKRMRRIILPSAACLAIQYFFTLYHKRHDFRKALLNIKYVFLSFSKLLPGTLPILRNVQTDIIINVCWSSSKVPVILVKF